MVGTRTGFRRARDLARRLVHVLAGGGEHGTHAGHRRADHLRPLALLVPRTPRRARPRRRAVRATDGRRRRGVPGNAARPLAAIGHRHPARPRLLQRRRGRAHRGAGMAATRRALRGCRPHPGRQPLAGDAHDRRAVAARSGARCCGNRLPVQLHLVRRDQAPRWTAPHHPRGRDLPACGAAGGPGRRVRARARAAPRRRRRPATVGARRTPTTPGCGDRR